MEAGQNERVWRISVGHKNVLNCMKCKMVVKEVRCGRGSEKKEFYNVTFSDPYQGWTANSFLFNLDKNSPFINRSEKNLVRRAISSKKRAITDYFPTIQKEPQILSILLSWKSFTKFYWQKGPLIKKYYPMRTITQKCSFNGFKEKCEDICRINITETNSDDGNKSSNFAPDHKTVATSEKTARRFKEKTSQHQTCVYSCSIKHLQQECLENFQVREHSINLLPPLNPDSGYPPSPLHVHIIRGGIVNSHGNVRVRQTEIIPLQCQAEKVQLKPGNVQQYKVVFVISQFWGGEYFHANIEDLPRLFPYLEYLKKYPEIKIHSPASFIKYNLKMIGLNPNRLVKGQVKAEVIYVPQGGGCSWLHPISGQLLYAEYQKFIERNWNKNTQSLKDSVYYSSNPTPKYAFAEGSSAEISSLSEISLHKEMQSKVSSKSAQVNDIIVTTDNVTNIVGRLKHNSTPTVPAESITSTLSAKGNSQSTGQHSSRPNITDPNDEVPNDIASSKITSNSIILIQRSKKRYLAQHNEVKKLLQKVALENDLFFEVFSDSPLPTYEETVSMFARARLVVAPHGAGLSNLMYSQVGTLVVEILCNVQTVLCYQRLHTALGQPYVGLLSTKPGSCGPLYVDLDYLELLVRILLRDRKETGNTV